jgi:hypothetical protein
MGLSPVSAVSDKRRAFIEGTGPSLSKWQQTTNAHIVSLCAIATALPKRKKRQMAIAKIIPKTMLREANDDVRDVSYWLSRPVAERLAAVEALRLPFMEVLPLAEQRLQRVYRVTTLKRG